MGDLQKSLDFGLKAIAIQEKVLPPEHPNLAASYNNIAGTYKAMGDLQKSLDFGLKAIAIREKTLPPEHPKLAASDHNIAGTHYHLSEWEQALSFEQKALQIWLKALPFGHPDTENAVNSMAVILHDAMKEKGKKWAEPYVKWLLENCKAYLR